jgi:hypothetical protein
MTATPKFTVESNATVIVWGKPNPLSWFGLPPTTAGYALILAGPSTPIFGAADSVPSWSGLPYHGGPAVDTFAINGQGTMVYLNNTAVKVPAGHRLMAGAKVGPYTSLCPAWLTGYIPQQCIAGWTNVQGIVPVNQSRTAVPVIDVTVFKNYVAAATPSVPTPVQTAPAVTPTAFQAAQSTVQANQAALSAATSTGTAMQNALATQLNQQLATQETANTIAGATAKAELPQAAWLIVLGAIAVALTFMAKERK